MTKRKTVPVNHYCSCVKPKKVITSDDKGRRVVYCDKCWKPVK